MTIFDGEPDSSVAFEAPRSGKVVRGEDIAKTTARRATEEERWRYGVELRILGSRWRPQTRAPHYPTPEPYVYRKRVQSLAWAPYQLGGIAQATKYEAWLAARDKAAAQPENGNGSEADQMQLVRPKTPAASTVSRRALGRRIDVQGRREESSEGAGMTEKPTADVVRLHVATSTPAREDMAERKAAAAQLLRDIAGGYGPRRAHKLRAMADWLTAPAAQIKREG